MPPGAQAEIIELFRDSDSAERMTVRYAPDAEDDVDLSDIGEEKSCRIFAGRFPRTELPDAAGWYQWSISIDRFHLLDIDRLKVSLPSAFTIAAQDRTPVTG